MVNQVLDAHRDTLPPGGVLDGDAPLSHHAGHRRRRDRGADRRLEAVLAAESQRYQAVNSVRNQRRSSTSARSITHDKGPIAREEWRLDNVNGKSTASYIAENRAGTPVAKFTEPIQGYDVTFAFEKLVQDGIWELQTRPLRGKTDDVYTISVAQVDGDRSGSHKFTFADPHYLATTAGREYDDPSRQEQAGPQSAHAQVDLDRRPALSEASSTISHRSARRASRRRSRRRGRSCCTRDAAARRARASPSRGGFLRSVRARRVAAQRRVRARSSRTAAATSSR